MEGNYAHMKMLFNLALAIDFIGSCLVLAMAVCMNKKSLVHKVSCFMCDIRHVKFLCIFSYLLTSVSSNPLVEGTNYCIAY